MKTFVQLMTVGAFGVMLTGCATAQDTSTTAAQQNYQQTSQELAQQSAEADQARELNNCILFANQGDYQNAIRACKDATAGGGYNEEQTAAAYANLGVAYSQVGKLNLATNALQSAERLNPNDPFVLYNMAALYSLQDKTDLSLEYLDMALARGFENYDALRFDRDLDNVRGEPEFRTVLENNKVFIQ